MKHLKWVALVCLTIACIDFVPRLMAARQDTYLVFLPIVSKPPIPLEQLSLSYMSDRDGNWEIYSMRGDGQAQVNLTSNPASDGGPVWSPDGTQIAFSTNRDGNSEIYRMQADGTAPLNLTVNSACDRDLAWSPDGSQIAFSSDRDGNSEIYTMASDGTGPINLTNMPGYDIAPAWSPDGTQIAFLSDRDGDVALYVMQADGASPTRLAGPTYRRPAWSPDGSRIAYILDEELFVTTVSNTLTIQLTDFDSGPTTLFHMSEPAWSPNGERLLFYRTEIIPAATPYVYTIKADGSESQAKALAKGFGPAWSPDGAYIAFNTKFSYQIVRMRSDGSEQTVLTDQGDNLYPTWTLLPAAWR